MSAATRLVQQSDWAVVRDKLHRWRGPLTKPASAARACRCDRVDSPQRGYNKNSRLGEQEKPRITQIPRIRDIQFLGISIIRVICGRLVFDRDIRGVP